MCKDSQLRGPLEDSDSHYSNPHERFKDHNNFSEYYHAPKLPASNFHDKDLRQELLIKYKHARKSLQKGVGLEE